MTSNAVVGRLAGLAAAAGLLLALAGCHDASSDEAFGKRVRTYLLSHPEVLSETAEKLQAKMAADAERQEAAEVRQAQARLPGLRAALERDPRDFVAHPGAPVTVSEFYDYRCPHCIAIAPQVAALARDDASVRVVFKELPIFGALSEQAARAALAVKVANGDSLGFYQHLMAARNLDATLIDRLAMQSGADPANLQEPPSAAVLAQLKATRELFTKLRLEGTPTFIVGDQIVIGDRLEELRSAIAKAEAKAKRA